jgi:hypothetical protein
LSQRQAEVGQKLDPAAVGQNNVTRIHTQLPIPTAAAFDDIPGTDRKTGWKGTRLTM